MMRSVLNSLRKMYRIYINVVSPKRFLVRKFILNNGIGENLGFCVDVGAGTCPFREQIIDAFSVEHYLPTEIAPNELTAVVSDAVDMPYRTSSTSMVTAFQVIQHIPDFQRALHEWSRVIHLRGYLLITYPFMFGEADVHDFHRWTYEGIAHDLKTSGFQIISHEKQGGLFLMLASVFAGFINNIIPGGRQTWRMKTNFWMVLRLLIITILTFPVALLSWLGLAIDLLWETPPFYGSGIVLAQRSHKK